MKDKSTIYKLIVQRFDKRIETMKHARDLLSQRIASNDLLDKAINRMSRARDRIVRKLNDE